MDALALMLVSFIGYLLMYRLYGRFLSKKIFAINPDRIVPAQKYEDGIDFVPTEKQIIFGHHFTSIAGTGPIVGPAIAVIWGWLPALLWVFIGSVVMGAVHDFGALVISLRNEGKSISDYTSKYINKRARTFFFILVFLSLWIVIAIFGLVIASIFKIYPSSVAPVWLQVPISILLGFFVYKKGKNLTLATLIAVAALYFSMIVGSFYPIEMPSFFNIPATGIWTIILLIYAFFASILPVTTLLQPRDYINAYQLIITMALLVAGIFVSAFGDLEIVAPAYQQSPEGAPSLIPFLFITVACGAISGFHSLVSSGTSAKQLKSEKDALFVGYGSMLLESALAVIVIIAVAAGIGLGYEHEGEFISGIKAWNTHYSSWTAAQGLASKIGAFVDGSANMIESIGIAKEISVVVMGVFVASFAGTTLDTATRIQRYVITEIFSGIKINILKNLYFNTFIAVATAAVLAFASGANGSGALALWPMFGAVNQTLASLTLIVITLYLQAKGKYKWLITGIPALFMSIVTIWASILNETDFLSSGNILLIIVNGAITILVISITFEGFSRFLSAESRKNTRPNTQKTA